MSGRARILRRGFVVGDFLNTLRELTRDPTQLAGAVQLHVPAAHSVAPLGERTVAAGLDLDELAAVEPPAAAR